MVEACETRDALVSNSVLAKDMPGRAQALPNACCALPPTLQIEQDTVIEQSNILLKQSVIIIAYANYNYYIVTPALLCITNTIGIVGGAMGIKKNYG